MLGRDSRRRMAEGTHRARLLDPGMVRKDWCGAWMQWHQYGRTDARFRWEVDHIVPIAHGGSDDLLNLQPLQWVTNRHKGDNYPH